MTDRDRNQTEVAWMDESSVRILHVDDDRELAELTAEFLERHDDRFVVRTETTPDDAFDRLETGEFDCVISDYDMPGQNGIEFLESVRTAFEDLPFVLYTGKGSETVASRAISAGVTDYLQKGSGPDHYELLANRVANAVEQYRATQAADRTRRRCRELAEVTGDVLWVFSAAGDELLFINSAYEDIWGQRIERLREHSDAFLEAVHPDDRERAERAFERARNGDAVDLELRVNADADYKRWVAVQAAPVTDGDGTVERIVGFSRDITDRKTRERRFEAILDSTFTLTGLMDSDGTVLAVNEHALTFGGLEREDVVGKPLRETDWFEATEAARESVRKALERAREGEFHRDEIRIQDTDGEAVLDFSVRPITDEDGTVTEFVLEGRDVTARRQRECGRETMRERMELALDRTGTFVFEVDPGTNTVSRYGDVEQFLGLTSDQAPTWEEFTRLAVHPEDRERFQRVFRQLTAGERAGATIEFRTPPEHAQDRWIRCDVSLDAGGERRYVIGVARDITDHKERERELERIRDFFTEAEQLGNLGAWEYDASGNVVWTDGTRRIHDVDDEFEPTVENGIEFFHADDREAVRQAVETALEQDVPYDVEARLITASGDQRWVRTHGKRVDSAGGQPTVRGFIQDITEAKERERELQEAKSQLEAAVTAADVWTWEWHVPEDELVVGPEFARIFGVDPDAARDGVSLERFVASIHEDDRARINEAITAAMDDCGDYEAEYRVWNADDELRWVVARGEVNCDDEGNPISFPGALTDITELKAYEQQLEAQNERLDAFASAVSHDLRNPLQVAEGRLEFLAEECDSEHLDEIARSHDRMRTLIDDLLALARNGEKIDETEPVDLTSIVDDCWRTVETADAELRAATESGLQADRDRLQQLLENLFRNAVEHGGDDVTVTVGTLDDGFYVEDDGPGIAEAERDHVFETGYSTAEGGTGFGLNVVEQVATGHGWEVRVTDGLDGGARFEFTGVESPD